MKEVIILLQLLVCVNAQHSNNFERSQALENYLCSSVSTYFGTTRSKTECAFQCGLVPQCQSFLYNRISRDCHGVTEAIPPISSCTVTPGNQHYVHKGTRVTTTTTTPAARVTTTTTTPVARVTTTTTTPAARVTTTTTTPVTYGSGCSGHDDCSLSNTECVDNTCQCSPGYSLKSSTHTCVSKIGKQDYATSMDPDQTISCATYGSTFIEYTGRALFTNAVYDESPLTSEECQERCVARPTCVNYNHCNYASCNWICRLVTGTPLTYPDSFIHTDKANYYMRGCADP